MGDEFEEMMAALNGMPLVDGLQSQSPTKVEVEVDPQVQALMLTDYALKEALLKEKSKAVMANMAVATLMGSAFAIVLKLLGAF